MKLKNSFQEYDMAVNLLLNSPKRAAKIFVTVEVASLTTNLVQPMPQLETRLFAVIKPFQPLVRIRIEIKKFSLFKFVSIGMVASSLIAFCGCLYQKYFHYYQF